MNIEQMQSLDQGDVIRKIGEWSAYMVMGNYGSRLTAARSFDVTNGTEWLIPEGDISRLRVGQVITHADMTSGYVVTGVYGNRATAMISVDVTDPTEWEITLKRRYLRE